jgi:CDP-glucose 4,6-dehydratase
MGVRQSSVEEMVVNASRRPSAQFWKGRRVFLTGHTGFKGSWLSLWLSALGADVHGFALRPAGEHNLFSLANVSEAVHSTFADLRDGAAVESAVNEAKADIVFHLAAQPIVRRSIQDPLETWDVNVMGTVRLLEALRNGATPKAILIVTSDKVYANDESGRAFLETDELGSKDPYSASKAAVELVTRSYAATYFKPVGVGIATARAGNVVGGGDFAADRIIPDAIRAITTSGNLTLRHPNATRPWQHVLDCLNGYLLYAEALEHGSSVPSALNFGPVIHARPVTVAEVVDLLFATLGSKAAWSHAAEGTSREMMHLGIDTTLASTSLHWHDTMGPEGAISATAKWYRQWLDGEDVEAACRTAIRDFMDVP